MTNNRRSFIQTSMLGIGLTSINLPAQAQHKHHKTIKQGKTFDPSKEPKRVRKNFYDLTDEELKNLCRAIGYMRNNYPLEHPLQWDNYAKLHALHCTEANADHPPVHWSWNFLPWHKGYLYFLERILANILTTQFKIDGSKFALPYWDWTTFKEMPNTKERIAKGLPSPFFGYDRTLENMVNDDGLGFDNSALYDGNRGPTIEKFKMDPANELTQDSKDHVAETLHFMSQEYVAMMLAAPFEQFGGKPVTDRQTGQGLLEQGPHNDGHDWIGTRFGKNRTMGTLRNAAADPMFYMHHGNIDRIWSMYTQPQPDPKGPWGKQQYNFLDIDGTNFTLSVQEIIEKLTNVTYDNKNKITPVSKSLKTVTTTKINVNKEIESQPIDIAVSADMFSHDSVLLDIITGPIPYTEKYTIKIFAGKQYLGKIRWLDGEYRVMYKNPQQTHTFSMLLTRLPKSGQVLTLVPPKRGIKIIIKFLEYKPL